MKEGHRMEDENEWPYLVWEKKDNPYPPNPSDNYDTYTDDEELEIYEEPKSDEEKVHSILDSMDLTYAQHMILFNKTMSFLNAKDCTGLSVESGFTEYSFIFTRENEYIKTKDEFIYNPALGNFKRIFQDCYSRHYYDNLEKNPQFRHLVKSTGFKFIGCSGGYVTDYSMARDEFKLKDEIDIRVNFKVGSVERIYKLDLDNMKLSEDYFEYKI